MMAIGALISAYQEDDRGELRALLPLAGRTLIDYQVRSVAAAGAAPVVVVVERVPQALQDSFERLRLDGISVFPVSDVAEAVSRFEAGSMILVLGDGVIAPADMVSALAEEAEPAIATVSDDDHHQSFERIDSESRWAGVAVIDAGLLASTARMLGDWDLQSTLLRRAIQDGARRIAFTAEDGEPILAESADQLGDFQRSLMAASRASRNDWPSRFILPPIEQFTTERLMETQVKPPLLIYAALALTVTAAFAFFEGWPVTGLGLLLLASPLDLIAARLANLRLQSLAVRMPSRRALWPAAGAALVALGWWAAQHGPGWAPAIAAISACAFAEAARIEKPHHNAVNDYWLFSRRGAIFAAIPFAIFGAWSVYLVAMWLHAAASFFVVQHARHHAEELTRI
ncbi:MAG: NTP transferase domain-containing protein [Sphingomicrobium sp.]